MQLSDLEGAPSIRWAVREPGVRTLPWVLLSRCPSHYGIEKRAICEGSPKGSQENTKQTGDQGSVVGPCEGREGDERPLEQLAWKGVEVEGLVERGEERVVAWKRAALSRALLKYEGLRLLWPRGLCGGLDVAYGG